MTASSSGRGKGSDFVLKVPAFDERAGAQDYSEAKTNRDSRHVLAAECIRMMLEASELPLGRLKQVGMLG